MCKRFGKWWIGAIIAYVLFIALIIGLKTIDVNAIGPLGSEIGFSGINSWFRDSIGFNEIWYDITFWLGNIAIASAFVFVVLGLYQLIKRKSLFKIDFDIYLIALFYVIVGITYIVFDKIVINYRPVILEGELEVAFPSSHTMIVMCLMGFGIHQVIYRISSKKLRLVLMIACISIMSITVIGRLISGVHWFTDILGGVFISSAYIFTYLSIFKYIAYRKNK